MLKISPKLVLDGSKFIARDNIAATECLIWCSRSKIFTGEKDQYSYYKIVNQALEGYKELPNFNLVQLTTHAWFAGRSNHEYSSNLFAIGLSNRQNTLRLSEKDNAFIRHFAQAIFDDLKPVIEIVSEEYRKVYPDEVEETRVDNFPFQLVSTYEWMKERSLDLKNSPISRELRRYGLGVAPLIDCIPHAEKHFNSTVCVLSKNCNKETKSIWAEQVLIETETEEDLTKLEEPVLLISTRPISNGKPITRNCFQNRIGVTLGEKNSKLPRQRFFSTTRIQVKKVISNISDIGSGLEAVPDKIPTFNNNDEVIIKIRARALNWVDLLMLMGQYQHGPKLPYTFGVEYSGEVFEIATGSSKEFKVGDKVFIDAFSNVGPRSSSPLYQYYGGFAQYALVPQSSLRKGVVNATFSSLCACSAPYETAYYGLATRGNIQPNECVWIVGATGSTGSAAAELAANIYGCSVVIFGGSKEKLETVKKWLGNENVQIAAYDEDLSKFPRPNVVFDTVGGNVQKNIIRHCEFGARILLIGWTSTPLAGGGRGADEKTTEPPNSINTNLLLMKGLNVIGCPAVISSQKFPDQRKARMEVLNNLLQNQKINPLAQVYDSSKSSMLETCIQVAKDKWNRKVIGTSVVI